MTDINPPADGDAPEHAGLASSPTDPSAITGRAVNAHAQERLHELDEQVVDLERSLNGWRTTAEALAAELKWTQDQLSGLGRVVRVAMTTRRAIRNPRSLVRFPAELVRALRAPLDPIRIPARPGAAFAAGGARPAVAEAILDRARHRPPVKRTSDLTVAIVADQRLIDGFGPACRLIELRPDRWREQLDADPPDLLIVGSAWQANGGAWRYRVATHAHRLSLGLPDLTAVTAWCAAHGVPSAFWNTEDPVRTDRFFEAACLVDWIFTVDPGRVEAYRALDGRRAAGVDVLAPAIQPRIHRPDRVPDERRPGALMADGGDPAWPLDRRTALVRLAAAAADVGLTILDPRLGEMPRGDLPPALRAARELRARFDGPPVYSRYPVVLAPAASTEVIPVTALEAVASGAPVVMTAHRTAAASLPDLVVSDDDDAVLRAAVEQFAAGDGAADRQPAEGLRRAIRVGTYDDRLREISRAVGITVDSSSDRISMLLSLDGDADIDRAAAAVADQEQRPDEVVIGAARWATGLRLQERLARACPGLPVVLVEQASGPGKPAALARLAAGATATWLLVVDPRGPVDPGLVDRHAALLRAGLAGPADTLLERASVLDVAAGEPPVVTAGTDR